jgi:hypothetical protein
MSNASEIIIHLKRLEITELKEKKLQMVGLSLTNKNSD